MQALCAQEPALVLYSIDCGDSTMMSTLCFTAEEECGLREQLFVGETRKNVTIFISFKFLKHILSPQKSMTPHRNDCLKIHHLKSLTFKKILVGKN